MPLIGLFNEWLCSDVDGYWTHAATLLGYDWSSAVKHVGYYYSWGYSLVLCIPLLLSTNFAVMNTLAILLNIVFCVIIFNIYYSLIRKLETGFSETMLLLITFTASTYSSIIFMCTVSLAEIFIYLFMALNIYLMYRYFKSEKLQDLILAGISIGFTYIIHHRMIGIIAAYLIIALIESYRQKKAKLFLVAILSIGSMLLLDHFMSDYLLMKEKDGVFNYNKNTYDGAISQINNLMQAYGLINLVENILGSCWYLLTASFLIGGLGLYHLIKQIQVNKQSNTSLWYAFILLSLVSTMFVSIVFFWSGQAQPRTRIDTMFYGRYFEVLLPILIILGMIELYQMSLTYKCIRKIIIVFLTALLCAVLLHYITTAYDNNNINYHGVSGVLMTLCYPSWHFSIKSSSIVAFIGASLIIFLILQPEKCAKYIGTVLLCFLFLYMGINSVYNVSLKYKQEADVLHCPTYNQDFMAVKSILEERIEETIYIVTNVETEPMSFQIWEPTREVIAIPNAEIENTVINGIVVLSKNSIAIDTFLTSTSQVPNAILLDNTTYYVCTFSTK